MYWPRGGEGGEDTGVRGAQNKKYGALKPAPPPPGLSAGALEELMRYDFPGNVRELENILERALALSGGASEFSASDLALHRIAPEEDGVAAPGLATRPGSGAAEPLPAYLDRLEREAILAALAKTGFNRTAASRLLGITFRQLRYRMQRLGIREEDDAKS
jgi:two-component system response regulator PilR (NtrC family)